LDGGRLLFLLLEGIRGKPLDLKKEELVHYIGFLILISLIFLVTYQDVVRLTMGD
jgi:regulator of sigma E protease